MRLVLARGAKLDSQNRGGRFASFAKCCLLPRAPWDMAELWSVDPLQRVTPQCPKLPISADSSCRVLHL